MCSHRRMICLIIIISLFEISKGAFLSTSWYKSPFTGSNPSFAVLHSAVVRSSMDCMGQCSTNFNECLSVAYTLSTKSCTFLSTQNQEAPFEINADLVHYSVGNGISYLSTVEALTSQINTTAVQPPTTTPQLPTTTEQRPTTTEQLPTTTPQLQTTTSELPTTTGQRPTTTEQRPTTTEQLPTTTEQRPTTTEQRPTTTEQLTTTTEQLPSTTPQLPTTTPQLPTTTSKLPTTTGQRPTTTPQLPTTTTQLPTTTVQGPTTAQLQTTTIVPNGCPSGYAHLPQSNTCVKHWPNEYLPWADSLFACSSDGASLPMLDTDIVFNEFRNWMDANANDRVAVFAKYNGQKYVWDNGVTVDSTKYCTGNPDAPGANMCLYMEDIAGTWCGSATNRLDDGPCSTESLRICMIKL